MCWTERREGAGEIGQDSREIDRSAGQIEIPGEEDRIQADLSSVRPVAYMYRITIASVPCITTLICLRNRNAAVMLNAQSCGRVQTGKASPLALRRIPDGIARA